jgi:hypothetical protein
MKQSELVTLLGLTVDDLAVTAAVAAGGGKPLKATNPNNATCESIDKAHNIALWAHYDIINERFQPTRNAGKKWVTYLWCIRLVEREPTKAKPDPKPTSFWDMSPEPGTLTTQAEIEAFFGPHRRRYGNELAYRKQVAKDVDVTIRWDVTTETANSYWLKVSEDIELKPAELLDLALLTSGEYAVNAELMGIKWLFDRGYLSLPADTAAPTNSIEDVHQFVTTLLNGHLWASQLNPDIELLHEFVVLSQQANYGIKKGDDQVRFYTHFTLIDSTDQAANFHATEQRDYLAAIAMIRAVAFNDDTYRAFATSMDASFARYRDLIADGYA